MTESTFGVYWQRTIPLPNSWVAVSHLVESQSRGLSLFTTGERLSPRFVVANHLLCSGRRPQQIVLCCMLRTILLLCFQIPGQKVQLELAAPSDDSANGPLRGSRGFVTSLSHVLQGSRRLTLLRTTGTYPQSTEEQKRASNSVNRLCTEGRGVG